MKQTPHDLTFFKGLSETDTGRYLADYVKRLTDFAHDSRSWTDKDSKESAAHAARLLQEHLLDKIRPTKKSEGNIDSLE